MPDSGPLPFPAAVPAELSVTVVAEPAVMVEGQGLAALGAEADVVLQAVEQDLVDLLCHLLPTVVKPVLVHGALEGLGEGEVQVQLPAVQLQLRQGSGVSLRMPRLGDVLPLLVEPQELEEKLPQGRLRLVEGDVGGLQLLLLGQEEAHLTDF